MRFTKSAMLGVVGSAFFAAGSIAADVPPMVVNTTPPPTIVVAQHGFNWAGPYVGGYVGCWCYFASGDGFGRDAWIIGGQAGLNLMLGDRFFVGPEIALGRFHSIGTAFEAAATFRAGVLLGDRLAVYVEAGIWTIAFDDYFFSLGGGVELGIGDALSIFAEAAYLDEIGAGPPGYIPFLAKVGVNWHLGN